MNWDELSTFRVVAEERSFTRAARREHVSVSAVSQRVRRLERSLRRRLLARTTTSVEVTDAGRVVLAAVMDIDRRWERVRAELAGGEPRPVLCRPLRVAFYRLSPGPVWRRVVALDEAVEWEPRHYLTVRAAVEDLRRGEVDLLAWRTLRGPTVSSEPDLTGLHAGLVADDVLWAFVGREHPLAGRSTVELTQLTEYDWVAPPEDARDLAVRVLAELGPHRPRMSQHVASGRIAEDLLRTSTAVHLDCPSRPVVEGIVGIPMTPTLTSRHSLAWREHPTVTSVAPALLDLFRRAYVEQAAEHNPRHLAHMVAHPAHYPGVALSEVPPHT